MFNYSYYPVPKGENQYADLLENGLCRQADARYVRSFADARNPMIEALPRYLTTQEVASYYNRPIPTPSAEYLEEMDLYDKLEAISLINNLRFPLNFHADLEREFHAAIVDSYRKRMQIKDETIDIPYTMNGKDEITHAKLVATDPSASVTGFSLLGTSGCGKSSAINILTSRYPQVITHHPTPDTRIQQIVWLKVVCPYASNFSTLFEQIGAQIDLALGNLLPVYQTQVEKAKTLGKKVAVVANLIELFSIGIIVFDEIQRVKVNATSENSIETLLTLNNMTNVALGVIGTEDAFFRLFREKRVARRLGAYIEGQHYCENRDTFNRIMKQIFNYSWTAQRTIPTEEMLDEIYTVTNGVIDSMIILYKYVQIDMVKAIDTEKQTGKKTPVLDMEFLQETIRKHNLLKTKDLNKKNGFAMKQAENDRKAAQPLVNTPEQQQIQKETEAELEQTLRNRDMMDPILQKQRLVERLANQYPAEKVEKAYDKLSKKQDLISMGDDDASVLVIQVIEKKDADSLKKKEAKKNRPTHDELKDILMSNHDTDQTFGKAVTE